MQLTRTKRKQSLKGFFLFKTTFLPSLAWQFTLVEFNKLESFSSLPDLAASSNSSF